MVVFFRVDKVSCAGRVEYNLLDRFKVEVRRGLKRLGDNLLHVREYNIQSDSNERKLKRNVQEYE